MLDDNQIRESILLDNESLVIMASAGSGKTTIMTNKIKKDLKFNNSHYTVAAVTIEIPDAIYLVKIKVKTDDIDDIEKWLEGEEEAETEQVAGAGSTPDSEGEALPDDNISQYGGEEDSGEAQTRSETPFRKE